MSKTEKPQGYNHLNEIINNLLHYAFITKFIKILRLCKVHGTPSRFVVNNSSHLLLMHNLHYMKKGPYDHLKQDQRSVITVDRSTNDLDGTLSKGLRLQKSELQKQWEVSVVRREEGLWCGEQPSL